jgi:hypothetical protein
MFAQFEAPLCHIATLFVPCACARFCYRMPLLVLRDTFFNQFPQTHIHTKTVEPPKILQSEVAILNIIFRDQKGKMFCF